jgi:MFS family permease
VPLVRRTADDSLLAAHPGNEPDRRRWVVFAVVGVAFLTVAMDQTSVATALSSLQRDLRTDLAWTGWTITIYSVGQILALPLAGRLAAPPTRARPPPSCSRCWPG